MLRRLQVAGRALLSVINHVLDLSKIEAGEMSLEMAPLDMNVVLRDVAALVELPARDKGLAFVVDIPHPLPTPLEGDSTRIMQIVLNLLSNAIKFTEHGEVRLTAGWEALGEDRYEVCLRISDTGIGIDEEARQRLFAPFVQADVSTTRRYGGTGLGLSIVKQLAEIMSGRIDVSSAVGQGSQFVVTLPMRYGSAGFVRQDASTEPGTGAGLPGVRVLVVDDNEINREIAKRILQSEGASVEVASNGRQALDVLYGSPGDFDVVLMDVHMPVLNGLDATRQIRTTEGWKLLPVIGLTAGVSLSEQNAAIAAGMDTVIGKPFDPPMLVRTIRRAVPSGRPVPSLHEPAQPTIASNGDPPNQPAGEDVESTTPPIHFKDLSPSAPIRSSPRSPLPAGTWPQLAGVDGAVSRARLQGHQPLFFQLVQRIVDTVDGLAACSLEGMPEMAARENWLRQLHDLKGMAGTLGAADLAERALAAEIACRDFQWQDLSAQSQAMAGQTALWAPLLSAFHKRSDGTNDGAAAESTPSPGQPLDLPAQVSVWKAVQTLRGALQTHDLAALDMWGTLAPQLASHMHASTMGDLQRHMDNLAFEEACHVLDAAMQPAL